MTSRKLVQIVARQLSTTARRAVDEVHPGYAQLRAKQAHFQIPDGKPVHLKGGAFDEVLYRLTMGLCAIGLVSNFYLLFSLVFPSKK